MAEYRGSINAKITASIIWVFIFFGIFITTVVLIDMRDDLATAHARDAHLLTMLIRQQADDAGSAERLADYIRDRLLPAFDFPRIELRADDGRVYDIARKANGDMQLTALTALTATPGVRVHSADGKEDSLTLTFFHTPFHQVLNARRTEIIMTFGLPLLGIAMLLFYITHRVITRPLLQVVAAIGKVTDGDMSQRVSIRRNDELGTLADFFNDMLAELDKKQTALKYEVRKHNHARREITRYSDDLRRANHELSTFSYTVSHDLRAPLRTIRGFTSALLEDHHSALGDEAKLLLQRIDRAGRQMESLIGDILDLSRVSQQEMVVCIVDLSATADEVIRGLQDDHPSHSVDITIERPLKATADPSLMRIAMLNLVGNAWKYSSKKTQPKIAIGRAEDDGEADCFYVRDNGSGFDMKYAKKLFVPFQRLHNSRDYEGTGIGLATVQRIIERHRGKIWATASPGSGACFYFSLPRQQV